MSIRTLRWIRRRRLMAAMTLIALVVAVRADVRGGISSQSTERQGISSQGISSQGISSQGISSQGISSQGISSQGISSQGISSQGISSQGISSQGISSQGISSQGISSQGATFQGISSQGISSQNITTFGLFGVDRVRQFAGVLQFRGIARANVQFRRDVQGMQATPAPPPVDLLLVQDPMAGVQLQAGPGNSNPGSFINVPGVPDLKGTLWNMVFADPCETSAQCASGTTCVDKGCIQACTSDAECSSPGSCVLGACSNKGGAIALYIADVETDKSKNFSGSPANDDVYLYTVYYRQPATGQWASLCPTDDSGKARAMAVPLNAKDWVTPASRSKIAFACTTTGVAAKCARTFGYKPWMPFTEAHYNACLVAARADYCQDDQSFTRDGTMVDLFDVYSTGTGTASLNPSAGLSVNPFDKKPMFHEEYQISVNERVIDHLSDAERAILQQNGQLAFVSGLSVSGLQSSRYPDLDPGRSCPAMPYIDRCSDAGCLRAANMESIDYGAYLAVNSPRHCSHAENQVGAPMLPECSACTARICEVEPTCCGDAGGNALPGSLVWDTRCTALQSQVCRSTPPGTGAENAWPLGVVAQGNAGKPLGILHGAVGSFEGFVNQGGVLYAEGWACDPDFPLSSSVVQISIGADLGNGTELRTAIADQPLSPSWRSVVSAECGAGERHGFRIPLTGVPAGSEVYLYGIDLNVPGAPFQLLRGGKKIVPGATALPNPRAAIFTGWVEPAVSERYQFNVDVGTNDKVRLWVNGQYLAGNWKDAAGTPGGFFLDPPSPRPTPFLQKGVRYAVRVEYLRPSTSSTNGSRLSVTWSRPGVAAAAVPTVALYPMAQSVGNGLQGTFFPGVSKLENLPASNAASTLPPTFGAVDHVWTDGSPPVVGLPITSSFGARFEGQLVPPISGQYTFSLETDGAARVTVNGQVVATVSRQSDAPEILCAHDICTTGALIDRSCAQNNFCAAEVCAFDSACCDQTWDARCVEEVKTYCTQDVCTPTVPTAALTLQAGWKYDVRVEYAHQGATPDEPVRGGKLKLLWSLATGSRDVIPLERLFAATSAAAPQQGTGINAAYYTDAAFQQRYFERVQGAIAFQTSSPPAATLTGSLICGFTGAPACPPAPLLGAPALVSASMINPNGEDNMNLTLAGYGAAPGAVLTLYERPPGTSGGTLVNLGAFTVTMTSGGKFTTPILALGRRRYVLAATQTAGGQTSVLSDELVVDVTDPAAPPAPTANPPTVSPTLTGGTVTVSGTATPGAAVTVTARVKGQTADFKEVAFVANASGGWTAPMTLPPGLYELFITQRSSTNHTSDPNGNVVTVKVPVPVLTLTAPAEGTTIECATRTCPVTISGAGANPSYGPVVVADGDGRFFVDLPTQPAIVPAAGGAFSGQVALDQGVHQLKVFQRWNGLDGDAAPRTVNVRPAASGLAVQSPAHDAVVDPQVTISGTGPARQGLRARVRAYGGIARLTDGTCPATATFNKSHSLLGEGPIGDDGRFAMTVAFSEVGRQCLALTVTQGSLSGAGAIESSYSPVFALRVRPPAPRITKPLAETILQHSSLAVAIAGDRVVGKGALVTIYADAVQLPSAVIVPASVTGSTFSATAQLPVAGTYRLTATTTADGAESVRTTPIVVAVGDVIPPTLKVANPADPARKPVREIAVTATSDSGVNVNFGAWITALDPASDGVGGTPLAANRIGCVPAAGAAGSPGPLFPLGTTAVSCTVTDDAGNSGTTTFMVVVKKVETPLLTGSGLSVQATGPAGAVVNYNITASGLVADCSAPGSGGPASCSAWRPAAIGLGSGGTSLAIDPGTGVFYASVTDSTGLHLLKSANAGGTWQELPSPGVPGVLRLQANSRSSSLPVLAIRPSFAAGLRISRDGGQSWTTSFAGVDIAGMAQDPADAKHLVAWSWASGPSALFESRDAGVTWEQAGDGLPMAGIEAVAMDPVNPDRMYLSLMGVGDEDTGRFVRIFRRTARTAPWQERPIFPYDTVFETRSRTIFVAPSAGPCPTGDPAHPFPAVFAGAVYSCDGGANWREFKFLGAQFVGFGYGFSSMVFDQDPAHPGRIYASRSGFLAELFVSEDYGESWTPVAGLDPVQLGLDGLFQGPGGGPLYASDVYRGIVRSSDGGRTWIGVPTGLLVGVGDIKDLAADPVDPAIAYVAKGAAGIFKTTNGGQSWDASNGSLQFVHRAFQAERVLVHPLARNVVLSGGLQCMSVDPFGQIGCTWGMSPDGGRTWGDLVDQTSGTIRTVGLSADPLSVSKWLAITGEHPHLRWPGGEGALPLAGGEGIFRLQMVPDANRTVVASLVSSPTQGRTVLFSLQQLLSGASPTLVETGLAGPANVVYDGSDGTHKLFVGGKALAGDPNLLYVARLDQLLSGLAAEAWQPLAGDGVFPSYQVNADPATTQEPFTTLLIDPVGGGQTMYTLGSGNTLWESRNGGRSWRREDSTPGFVSAAWLSPVDGSLYATISPTFVELADQRYLEGEAAQLPAYTPGVPWKRVSSSGSLPGARIVRGAPRVSCQGPPGFTGSVTPGSTFPIGNTVLTCSASDAFGNVGSGSFTVSVRPGAASNPSPANAATGVLTTTSLSWTAGAGATSHDVFFGTTNPPPARGSQTGTTYAPGTLAAGTTYFWRIDERGGAGVTTGSVWTFTTASAPTTLFSDNFESGNTAAWTTMGGTWSIITDGTKVLRQSNNVGDARISTNAGPWTDQIVTARVKPTAWNGTDRFVSVLARVQSSTSYYYATLRSSNRIEIKKLVNGAGTTLATKTFTVPLNSWRTVKLEVIGTRLRLFVDGTLHLSATDTTFASGKAGLATFNATAVFDDVIVTR